MDTPQLTAIPPARLILAMCGWIRSVALDLPRRVKVWYGWVTNPDVRTLERLAKEGMQLQAHLGVATGRRDRATLCTRLAEIARQMAELPQPGWKQEDTEAIRLEAALMSAAAQSEWALVFGAPQALEAKLPGIHLWAALQTETGPYRRAELYGQLAGITQAAIPGAAGEWRREVLMGLALSELPPGHDEAFCAKFNCAHTT